MSAITITRVTPADWPAFVAMQRAYEAAEHAHDPTALDRAERGVVASRASYDFTHSDTCWMWLVRVDDAPAGFASTVRVPKADERVGFLFVDELTVLPSFRRMGVASALLRYITAQARDLGLHGVRLLVRPQNEAARALYRRAGFGESETIQCQKIVS